MWKKSEETPASVTPASPKNASPSRPGAIATLGPSIVIKGDLTGEEDLIIEGRVEGEIRLTKNSVTVGNKGRVRADIYGKRVHVEGEVRGNLYGDQEIVIRASGRVQGNLTSPRVTLENGSKFKGKIDMEPTANKDTDQPTEDKNQATTNPSAQQTSTTAAGPMVGAGSSKTS